MTVSDEMVEAVARAIWKAAVGEVLGDGRDLDAEFDEMSDYDKETYIHQGRAALAAIAPMIREEERERCAKLMDERARIQADDEWSNGHSAGSRSGATAIRSMRRFLQGDGG